jgi:hypothetical protein
VRGSWKVIAATLAAAAMLVVGLDYTTFAVTGDSLILGTNNGANQTTTLAKRGSGPALRLRSASPKIPALAMNSLAKVVHLNADRVDGKTLRVSFTKITSMHKEHAIEIPPPGGPNSLRLLVH